MSKKPILMMLALLALTFWGAMSHAQPARHRMQLPPTSVTLPEGREVVEVPFKLERDKIMIPVRVNGSEPLSFILDTGAPIAALMNLELAEKMDFDIMGQAQLGGAGAGAASTVDLAGGVQLELQGIEIANATMAIGVGHGKLLNSGYDGIIGRSVFANLVVEIDFAKQVLRLYPPDTFAYTGNGTEIPLTLVGGSFPYIETAVSIDGGDAVPMSMVVDTGASPALVLFADSHSDLELPDTMVQSLLGWGASGPVHGQAGRITRLELGDHVLRDVVTSFPDASSTASLPKPGPGAPERHGALGIKVLKRFRVFFDYANTRLILEPSDMFDAPFTFNRAGLIPAPWATGDSQIEVGSVIASSPAGAAGIEVGDNIIEIDGKPVADIDVNQVMSLLEQPPGTKLQLKLRRGSQTLEKKLTLESLI
jgi:predicted aspartyl protease